MSWKGNTSSESIYTQKLQIQDPRTGFEWLRAPRRTNKTLLMGTEPWAETWEELGWRKGFAVISVNIRLWGFRFQLLTAGKDWGESTSEQFSKEHNHLGAGKGRLFLLHFICVGISNRENTENSLLEVVPVQPWISPDLPLVVLIILSLQWTHNFQIRLGSPKLVESLCLHQLMWASTKGREKGLGCWNFQATSQAFTQQSSNDLIVSSNNNNF